MTNEMYAANVKNWLMDLATGAKAAQRMIQFADAKIGDECQVTTRCFDMMEKGVAVHRLKDLAEVIGESVNFGTFEEDSYFFGKYEGYYYIDMFGVRFYDYVG